MAEPFLIGAAMTGVYGGVRHADAAHGRGAVGG